VFVTTLTKRGQIKKTAIADYQNYREKGIIGVKIADDDQLLSALVTDGTREFMIATKSGKSIRFAEDQVRAMGRSAAGVKGMDLEEGDEVIGFIATEPERSQVLAVCERGYGKRTSLEEFRAQKRGGKGIILIDASERNGPVVGVALVKDEDEVMLITNRGQTIRCPVGEIRETGRNAQGVKVMNVDEDERVVAVEPVGERGDDEDEAAEAAATDDGNAPDGSAPDGNAPDDADASMATDADAGRSATGAEETDDDAGAGETDARETDDADDD
ncbi:MAG TPA: DNA gyrase C-terminal beta-propeller domain-containing protein, partial [Polyangiaceae bacterium]|nr:DNA gyrase C-terminal beta-propeller domain-containing protein [Polyangiaceae bacterium]